MKSPTYRTRDRFTTVLLCAAIAITMGSLGACSPVQKPKKGRLPESLNPDHWYKVKDKPPTYYPRGVKADHPTTSDEGMWVMSGDEAGTCYFIPVRGCDTRSLCAEAISTRTRNQKRHINRNDGSDTSADGVFRSAADGIGNALFGFWRREDASTPTQKVPDSERMKR